MNPSFHDWAGDRRLKNLVLGVLVLTALALVSYAYMSFKQAKYVNTYGPTTISVRGVGEVPQVPDIATFSFGAHAEAADPKAAQAAAADASNAIIAYLKENGVAETDIKTLNYFLSPQYDYFRGCGDEMCVASRDDYMAVARLIGYAVDQTIQVKVRDTAKAGELLSGVGEHGAKNISGLAFTIDDTTAAKTEARGKAVADARAKAQQLADTLGVRLGKLNNFWEEDMTGYPPMYEGGYGGDAKASAMMAAPEVPGGENVVSSAVNLTYEIR